MGTGQRRPMKRPGSFFPVLLLTVLVAIGGIRALAQDKPVEVPPDLLHVHHLGCHINAHIGGHVFNAKTKEIENQVLWQVIPSAQYEDKLDVWDASKPIFEMAGTNTDDVPPEVTEACSVWVKHVRAMAIDEYKKKKKGHAVSRPALQKPREQDK